MAVSFYTVNVFPCIVSPAVYKSHLPKYRKAHFNKYTRRLNFDVSGSEIVTSSNYNSIEDDAFS